ncbi:DciA family protein [Achromobacter dolens]|uniref:DciA family protein n=1 Tax=Achromobacter dolens TaxID=1287738 RepID=UPI0022B8699C|nr:DciA family protein [Achromobacter dolens]MCZ8406988.1 DciA family protein [Achromobacter dolens]
MQENTSAAALIDALRTDRAALQLWQTVAPEYQGKHAEVLAPLEVTEIELKARLVLCFDHAARQKELTKAERQLVSEIAAQLGQETLFSILLDGTPAECDVERLKAVYRKHSGSDIDAEVAEEREAEAAEMAEMTASAQAQADAPATAATFAPDALAQAEALLALGPDGLDGVPQDKLALAVPVLREQLSAVNRELAAFERDFKAEYRFDPEQPIDPADLMEDLDAEIADVQDYIGELEFELSQFVDMQQLKAWLKAMKKQLEATRRREARG